ncbi:starch-binding domain-containing protein 1 isoform X1 [Carcharodon carcharias]|uniref:starch-binding domain-containing protein 1 isoform X1 n=1 Tax=Carcharodon carcharias TaxID=13397 RepID=UPI001B7EC404|nr:starch-binding domain-containing protein 1 isoform X1 [Carcharodon carcharias]
MATGLASLLQGLVAMLSSVWAVLPVALAVALSTWLWFRRGKNQESREAAGLQSTPPEDSDRGQGEISPEDGERRPEEREGWQQDSADKITGGERDSIPKIKTTELSVSGQQSPVLEAEDISDAMIKNEKESEQDQNLSNKQDLSDSKQKMNVCENNHTQIQLVAWPTNIGQVTIHNASITDECNYGKERMSVCETKSAVNIEKVHEKFEHKDEVLDLVSAIDQKFSRTDHLNISDVTDDICESNVGMSELKCIKTEMEREDKRKFFHEQQVNAEPERTNINSEPENIARKVAAVSPLPLNNISVNFNVHYITSSSAQILAVTGNHECLGQWEKYVPLKPNKDGFWSSPILLPVNSRIEWKYVVVEDGKICRWEECFNRALETGHEDFEVYQCWGYH